MVSKSITTNAKPAELFRKTHISFLMNSKKEEYQKYAHFILMNQSEAFVTGFPQKVIDIYYDI